ncbi:hypothetical protein DQ239_17005 [Blastococcus sp. TF02-09]|uniref:hypothetical protein n=1 Tax=Blastococcus sp. TF02-09 TaxID=2250576 RepID=UPI000DEA3245|nr:hypothetical protein [Blastococcus sp. TF02-9]RBY75371.1 hypothetical protein DQ239_17005 [Blastococcus sp. TF02-9]
MAPTDASGTLSRGNASATTRHTAITATANPAEASSQNGVPLCGWAPLSQAQSHCPTVSSSHPGIRS